MSAVATKLREARALIELGWTQNWFAKTASGEDCMERDPEAVCWCMTGALFRVMRIAEAGAPIALVHQAVGSQWDGLAEFNDAPGRTQAEVLAAFDKAIELAEAQS